MRSGGRGKAVSHTLLHAKGREERREGVREYMGTKSEGQNTQCCADQKDVSMSSMSTEGRTS